MISLTLNGESFSVSIASLVAKDQLFRTRPRLLGKPYRVESLIALDSLRVFIGAMAEISNPNARELSQLCDEFKFIELAKTVQDWLVEHPQTDAGIHRGLGLAQITFAERLGSQDGAMVMPDEALHRVREAAMSDAAKWRRWKRKCPGCDRWSKRWRRGRRLRGMPTW
jgi:hypothetical protein